MKIGMDFPSFIPNLTFGCSQTNYFLSDRVDTVLDDFMRQHTDTMESAEAAVCFTDQKSLLFAVVVSHLSTPETTEVEVVSEVVAELLASDALSVFFQLALGPLQSDQLA